MIFLPWREMPPIPERPEITIWTSLTANEARELRRQAAGHNVLEVGSAFGFSTLCLALGADHVWSIDLHNNTPGNGNYDFFCAPTEVPAEYQAGTFEVMKRKLTQAGLLDRVGILRGSSHDVLPGLFGKVTVDMAFIDGDHSFEACTHDLEDCERLMLQGGVIAVHDYEEQRNPAVKPAVEKWRAGRKMHLVDTLAVVEW